jgi:hypothetical protein
MAWFLRLKVWDVVYGLSELRLASVHWKLSAPVVITGIGFSDGV